MLAGWCADCERYHHETLESVRSSMNEQVSFNVQGVSISKLFFVN